jgi:predicted alpha-1,2-mannosidase
MPHVRSMKLLFAVLVALVTTLFAASPFGLAARAQAASSTANLASYVDPFTGTGVQQGAPYGGGDTFPGADVPFGMMQWSPDTESYAPGGYWYYDNRIMGFSLTHLNGAGCGVYSDIPFMPYVGTVTDSPATDPSRYISTFSHTNESAAAGYYQVKLDNGVNTELTATQRSGAGRFTYPQGQTATMLVNVSGSINGVSDAQANISNNTISGWATSGGFCGANDVYRVYFWAQFSQPFATVGTWHNNIVTQGGSSTQGSSQVAPAVHKVMTAQAQVHKGVTNAQTVQTAQSHPNVSVSGPGSGAFVTFDTGKSAAITAAVGLSFVSIDNAKANVSQEDPKENFDLVHQQATQTWNNWLGEIQVSGGTATQLANFYTAMYHALLQPNVFSDVNGQYIGFDGRIHSVAQGHAQYANFSGWDIYRSEAQLLAFLAPSQASDIAQSMVNDYVQSGMLPKWSLANAETYVMVGDPADPILADIYAFGGTNFDTQTALSAMIQEATQTNNIRPGLNYLENLGYDPLVGNYGCCNFYGPASTTLEYNAADFAIGAFAQALGDTANYQKFVTRSQDWENLLNVADSYLEPRYQDGSFQSPYDPTSGNGWVEGDGAQYNWMVPFNLAGLFASLGGNSKVVPRLDSFFTQLNGGPNSPYAFLGNEPTVETPWEYDYAGAPYKTQNVVRQIVNTLYMPGPGGMAGNDDLGEMSSWYVFAALGMFPETPGTANLVLASPLFPSMTVHRPSGQVIQINAPGASATTYYVQSLEVNGKSSTQPWLPPSFIANGGTLNYTLASTANTSWGAASADAPPSYQYGESPVRISFNPGRVVVAPGANAQGSVVAQSITSNPATINWSATAPSGLSITPSSGSITVPAFGSGSQSFSVAAAANIPEGYYSITFSAQTSDGSKLQSLSLPVVVAQPGSLLGLFNNIGISDDSNPGAANFDGDGFSYSAQQLANDGYTPGATVTVNGISYTWPNVPVATNDNVAVSGQTIKLPNAKAGASQLSFLGSSTNGPSTGTITITYTDGTTQTAQLGFSDWTLNAGSSAPSYNNVVAARTPYRNSEFGAPDQTVTYIFATAPIQLNTSKQVASIALPGSANQGTLHIFALTVS